MATSQLYSNLDLVKQCDSCPYDLTTIPIAQRPVPLIHVDTDGHRHAIAYLLPDVITALQAVPASIRGELDLERADGDDSTTTVRAFQQPTEALRTAALDAVLRYWRERDAFRCLRGWRDERYPVYDATGGAIILRVERAAAGLLGICNAGVHVTAYVRDATAPHGLRIWVATRAASKPTYPGMRDSSVAGGLSDLCAPDECMVKECEEEAGLPATVVRERATFADVLTYWHVTTTKSGGEAGFYQQEREWTYELQLPADMSLKPNDGEVGGFDLWTVEQVQQSMARGEWKYNCTITILAFLMRHGILTRENEKDYDEIVRRMHRPLDIAYKKW